MKRKLLSFLLAASIGVSSISQSVLALETSVDQTIDEPNLLAQPEIPPRPDTPTTDIEIPQAGDFGGNPSKYVKSASYYVKNGKVYVDLELTDVASNAEYAQVFAVVGSQFEMLELYEWSIDVFADINLNPDAYEKLLNNDANGALWRSHYPTGIGRTRAYVEYKDGQPIPGTEKASLVVDHFWTGEGTAGYYDQNGDEISGYAISTRGEPTDKLPDSILDDSPSTLKKWAGDAPNGVTTTYSLWIWTQVGNTSSAFYAGDIYVEDGKDRDNPPEVVSPSDPSAEATYFNGMTIGDVKITSAQGEEDVSWTWDNPDAAVTTTIKTPLQNFLATNGETAGYKVETKRVYPQINKGEVKFKNLPVISVKPGTTFGELQNSLLEKIQAVDKNTPSTADEYKVTGTYSFAISDTEDLADKKYTENTELLKNGVTSLPFVFKSTDDNYKDATGEVLLSNADVAILMGNDGSKVYDPNNAMQYPNLEIYYIGGLTAEQRDVLDAEKLKSEEAYAVAVRATNSPLIQNDAYSCQWYQGEGLPETDEGKTEMARTEPTAAGPQTVLVTFAENGTYPEGVTYDNCAPVAVGGYTISPATITKVEALPAAKTIYASNASNQTVEKLNEYIRNLTNPDYKEDSSDAPVFNTVEVTLKSEEPAPEPAPTSSEEVKENEPVIEPVPEADTQPQVAADETPEAPTEEPPVVDPTTTEPVTAQVAIETVKDKPTEAKLQASISSADDAIKKLKYDIKGNKTYTVYMPLVLDVDGDNVPEFEYDTSLTSEKTTEKIANEGQYAARSLEIKPVHLKVPTVEDPLPMMLALHAKDATVDAADDVVTLSANLTDLGYDVEPEGDNLGDPVQYTYEWKLKDSTEVQTKVSTAAAARFEYSGEAVVKNSTIPEWVSAPEGNEDLAGLVHNKDTNVTTSIADFPRRIEIVDASLELNRTLDTASQAELKASVQSGTFKDVTFTVTLPKAADKEKPTLVPCDTKGAEINADDTALAAENFFGSKLTDSDFVLKSATDKPNEAGDRVITATFGMPVPDPDVEPAVAQKYVQPVIGEMTDLLASSLKYTKTVTDAEIGTLLAEGAVSIELAYSDSNKLLLTPSVTGSVGKTLKLTMESYDPKKQADYILSRFDVEKNAYQPSFTMDRQVMKSWTSAADDGTPGWTGNGKGTGKYTQSPEITMIPAGTYKLEVRKPGHTPIVIEGIEIEGAEPGAIDVLEQYNSLDNTGKTGDITAFVMRPGDINGDGAIRVDDRNLAASGRAFGQKVDYKTAKSTDLAYICDLDGDGYVRLNDLDMITNPASLGKLLKPYRITKDITPVVKSSSVLDLADDLSNMLMESMTPGT